MLVKLLPPFVVLLVIVSLPWQHRANSSPEAPVSVPVTATEAVFDVPVAPPQSPPELVATTISPVMTTSAFTERTAAPEEARAAPISPSSYAVPSGVPERARVLLSTLPPEQIATMGLIAWCESRFVDDIVGEGRYVGWFQIAPDWLGDPDVIAAVGRQPVEALKIPEINVRVASVLAARHPDFRDWPVTRFGC